MKEDALTMRNASWKRLFAVLLTLVLTASLMPAAFAADVENEPADDTTVICTEQEDCLAARHHALCPRYVAPEQEESDPTACTCGAAEGDAHAEGCPRYVAPEQEESDPAACTCGAAEGDTHAEGCPRYVAPEQEESDPTACTCGAAEGDAHAETCPRYVAPEQEESDPAACTCGAAEGDAHAETCPKYVVPGQEILNLTTANKLTGADVKINPAACIHQNVKAVAANAPTCGAAGNKAYWHCPDCGKCFSDAACTPEVPIQDVTLPATGKHTYLADTYSTNSSGHWQVCTVCSAATAVQPHSYVPYNKCSDGVARLVCRYCGCAQLSLRFHANGGGNAPGTQTVVTKPDSYSGIIVISDVKPSRSGYYFQGWSTSPDGNVQLRPGNSVTINQDVTLYAVWARPTASPRTGDTSNIGLWIAVAGISVLAIGAVAFVVLKKKGGKEE